MEGLTLQIYNWLVDTEETETAKFLNQCSLEDHYIDTLFELTGEDMKNMFDVCVHVPIKIYKQLNKYTTYTTKIEEAIHDYAEADGVYIRNIEWKAQKISDEERRRQQVNEDIKDYFTEDYVRNKVDLMTSSIKTNPHLAIGSAKELIETCCKFLLKGCNIEIKEDWDILRLIKETNKVLELVPFEFEDSEKEKIKVSINKISAGFSNIVHGITELRNQFGSGHGHDPNFKELDEVYAKFAVSASSELVRFYLGITKLNERNI